MLERNLEINYTYDLVLPCYASVLCDFTLNNKQPMGCDAQLAASYIT